MYSWFYMQILNLYHFVDSALATSQNYPDAGLFILQTSAPEDKVRRRMPENAAEVVGNGGVGNARDSDGD